MAKSIDGPPARARERAATGAGLCNRAWFLQRGKSSAAVEAAARRNATSDALTIRSWLLCVVRPNEPSCFLTIASWS